MALTAALDPFGNVVQRAVLPAGETTLSLAGIVSQSGLIDERTPDAPVQSPIELPIDVTSFLLGSRYCETDKLTAFAWQTFGHLSRDIGMVEAICDFVHRSLVFDYKRARPTRTACDALEEGTGVCRDFTHLAITLCRAMNIPARYVNGYLGDIGVPPDPAPMDFNAWFDVYVGGRWYTFDARHNQRRIGRLPISYGRDASDVPMIHTFGPHTLGTFRVTTELVEGDEIPRAA